MRYPNQTAGRLGYLLLFSSFAAVWLACGFGGDGDAEEESSSAAAEPAPAPVEPLVESPIGGGGQLYQVIPAWPECPERPPRRRGYEPPPLRHCVSENVSESPGEGAQIRALQKRRLYDDDGHERREEWRRATITPGASFPADPSESTLERVQTSDYHPNGELRRSITWSIYRAAAVPGGTTVNTYDESGERLTGRRVPGTRNAGPDFLSPLPPEVE